jgi:plastocyanin
LRKLIALGAAVALLAAAVPALAATRNVSVGDNWFVRNTTGVPTVTVKKGTTVKWVWKGSRKHNVHAITGPVKFSSPLKRSGTYSKRMTRKGTYRLICDKHGAGDQSMKLVVN